MQNIYTSLTLLLSTVRVLITEKLMQLVNNQTLIQKQLRQKNNSSKRMIKDNTNLHNKPKY